MRLSHFALALTILLLALTGYLFYQGKLDRDKFAKLEDRMNASEAGTATMGERVSQIERAVGLDPDSVQRAQEREVLLAERELIDKKIGQMGEAVAAPRPSPVPGVGSAPQPPAPLPPLSQPANGNLAAGSATSPNSTGLTQPQGANPGSLPPLGAPNQGPGISSAPAAPASVQPVGNEGGGASASPQPKGPSVVVSDLPDLTPMQQQVKNSGALGKVEHYNGEWAFAVLDFGGDTGVEPGDIFAIRREHFVVAQVKVSEVKDGQTIANLVSGTLQQGMKIQPGDEVIQKPMLP